MNDESQKNSIDMTSGKILPKLIRFSIPVMLSGILQLAFNSADQIVVGRFAGDLALASVGATTAMVQLFINLSIGLSLGANVVVARHIGARDVERQQKAVHTSMIVAWLAGAFVMIFGTIFARPVLSLLDTPETLIDGSTTYVQILMIGAPVTLTYNFASSILKANGDTKRPLIYLTTAGVINVFLNIFFVKFLYLAEAGVALATVISNGYSAFMCMRALARENSGIRFSFKKARIDKQELKDIVRIGVPAGLQTSAFALANVVIQSAINGFGEIMIAGNTAATTLTNYIFMSMNAFTQAASAFTSQNMGAKKYKRILRIMLDGVLCVTVVGLSFGLIEFAFGRPLIHLFTESDTSELVIEAGMNRLAALARVYFTCGIMDVINGSSRGMGKSFTPMLITLIGTCAFRIAWVKVVTNSVNFNTPYWVFMCMTVSWIITGTAQAIYYFITYNKIVKPHLAEDVSEGK